MKTTSKGNLFQRKKDKNGKGIGNYYLVKMVNGKRTVLSLHTGNLKKALKKRDDILNPALQAKTTEKVIQNIAEARQILTDVKYPLGIVWKKYLESEKRPQSGEGSLANYERCWKAFTLWLKDNFPEIERINQITEKLAEQYITHLWEKNLSFTTVNHYIQSLKLIFKIILQSEKTPFRKIQKKKGSQINRKDFTPENLEAIFKALEDDSLTITAKAELKLLCYIGAYTGLRLSDAVFLKWENVDFARRVISCTPRKTKGINRQVHIPIHPELKSQLDRAESLKNGDEYILPGISERYKVKHDAVVLDFLKVLDHVGLKDTATAERGINRRLYGFHSFRHGFASMAANAGVPVAVLADILGDNIATLQKYYIKVSDNAKMNAVNSIMITGNNSTGRGIPETIDVKPVSEADELRIRINKAIDMLKKTKIHKAIKNEILKILSAS